MFYKTNLPNVEIIIQNSIENLLKTKSNKKRPLQIEKSLKKFIKQTPQKFKF